MTVKNWNIKMVVTKKDENNQKARFSKCSKLKRAISHKILRKTSNKHIREKNNKSSFPWNKSSVLLLSMRNKKEKNNVKVENKISVNGISDQTPKYLIPLCCPNQPLDLVIEEAKHQLLVEKLCDEEIRNFDGDRYSYSSSESTQGEEDDIYEEMDVLQSYFENIYNSDYLEMGLV